MSLLEQIRIAQRDAGEDAVMADLESKGLLPLRPVFGAIGSRDVDVAAAQKIWDASRPSHMHNLLGRCRSVISMLEGEDTTEQEMLNDLQRDIKQAMGITPLVPGTLV